MIQKYALVCLAFFAFVASGFGQIVAWELNGASGNEATFNATTLAANLNTSTLSRGAGLNASTLGNAFACSGFTASGTESNAISNNDYIEFLISAQTGYQVSLSTLDANFRRSGTGPNAFRLRYRINAGAFSDINATPISYTTNPTNGTAQTQIDLSSITALQNVAAGTTITIRLYGWGATADTGTFAIGRLAGNDLAIGGTVSPTATTYSVTYNGNGNTGGTAPTDATDYASGSSVTILGAGTLTRTGFNFVEWNTAADGSGTSYVANDTFNITTNTTLYAQWTAITDAVDFCNIQFPTASPQTITDGDNFTVYARAYEPGVTEAAGQGVGLNAWIGYNTVNNNPNDASWTWVPATFNVQAGNDDEFQAEIGSGLAPGTYYYASRFELNGGPFVYGGTGGIWNNDSVELIVQPIQVDFCNVDFPKTGTINQGENFNVFAHVFEPGVTNAAGPGANIEAWIGYNTVGINYEPWQATGWTWVLATYDSDFGNNDNYRAQIGSILPAGTYYYASRFRLNGSSFSYGGIQNDNVGNFWSAGTFNNGVLVVEGPTICASEGFEGSTNDPAGWSNFSGYYQNAAANAYSGTYHAGMNSINDWIRMPLLTDPTSLTFWARASGTTSNYTIRVQYSTDEISWFDSSVIIANGSNTGDITTTYQQFNINLNLIGDYYVRWFMSARTGGSFYLDEVEVQCGDSTPQPELQLVDTLGTDQNCGYTINFGSQALTTDTDITFDIENIGSADLDITSLALSGANAGDFSIVSPATPFTVTTGNIQTVTVRFTPSANGTRTATLTIDSNDANEGTCTVLLTGVGFTPAPEITVEGNVGAFPDIVGDGSNAPNGTNNTLYAAQFIGSSQTKSFWVNNEGTSDLTISSISIGGANPGDFTIDVLPSFTIAPGSIRNELLEITFSPLAAGERNATVTIVNDDNDETNFVFNIRGNGNCVSSATSIAPTSGPEGTIVTVTGSDFGGTTTATVSGVAASVTVISSTQIEVTIPAGATSGNIVVQNNLGCASTNSFTIIDTAIASCEGSGVAPNDLFISEITDATTGGVSYVEIYNGTGNPVNLADYGLAIHGNGASTPSYTLDLNAVILNNNDVYVVAIGVVTTQSSTNSCSITGGNGQLADQTTTLAGINKKDNEHDMIRLVKSGGSIIVDAFGVYENTTWMDATIVTGDRGFNFRRLNTASPLPNPVFNLADWNVIDWVGSGQASCSTNDYSDIGTYDFSVGTPPTVSALIAPTSDCDLTATLTVTGTEGFDGVGDSQELAYQWFYSAPGELGWTAVTNNTIYSGATTNTLDILNTLSLDGYQYYCQVREDDATCFRASNSIKLNVNATIWSAGSWSDGLPDINTIAIIDDNYNTNAGGEQTSFSACNLLVRIGTLTIANNTFVEVENNVSVESNIIVNEHGSFKQNNNAGAVTVTPSGLIRVRKETAPMNNWYEYTYWSSPVAGETIGNALNDATPNRRFWFNAQNYLDSFAETGNNNAAVAGQDDIDDAAPWDWTLADASDPMVPGVGYASTHRSTLFNSIPCSGGPNCQFVYTFEGPFNNGIYTVPVYRNDAELNDTNWNFIGNPYPSAISADLFLSANTILDNTIDGAIYLWSQNTAPADNANGNEVLNFAQADYAIINNSGQTAGGDGVPPTRHIPSGQGFFVSLSNSASTSVVSGTVRTADVVFNNQMRVIGNNNQFFRSADDTQLYNKLWINLTSNNGVFNQVLVSYIDGATDTDDGMYYDATRNLSTSANSILYSIIPNSDKKFAIQGKNPNSLTLDEEIPLGFYTSIEEATIYKLSIAQFEGDFFTNQTVYVKDNLLNLFHDLSAADYTFTSETGEFNERFEIVFQTQTLGIGEVDIQPNDVSIIELTNGHVKFTVGHNLSIQSVEIFDMLGRQLYHLPGSNATEIYNLSNLSQAAYVAKVTLSNGQTVTKRAVKQQ